MRRPRQRGVPATRRGRHQQPGLTLTIGLGRTLLVTAAAFALIGCADGDPATTPSGAPTSSGPSGSEPSGDPTAVTTNQFAIAPADSPACAWLVREEATAVLGVELGRPSANRYDDQRFDCTYASTDPTGLPTVTVSARGGADFATSLEVCETTAVTSLEREAAYSDTCGLLVAASPELTVQVVVFTAEGFDRAKAEQIAATVLPDVG